MEYKYEIKNGYAQKRLKEIVDECNINKALEGYYKMGLTASFGLVMYMLEEGYDRDDIKKVIMNNFKDDTQGRCDLFGIWGEMYDKNK